jgi:pyrroloquinoline quinone (PQQ) biosynthesis protein C
MAKNTKSKEVKPVNAWWCETCKSEEMNHAQMLAHLKEKHGLETKGLQCHKKMLMHMDGDTWFSSKYEVTIANGTDGILLTNETVSPRAKDDMMRYA